MADLISINALITACAVQVQLSRTLAPNLDSIELLDRAAAAIGCLLPTLPDPLLQFAMNEALQQLESSCA